MPLNKQLTENLEEAQQLLEYVTAKKSITTDEKLLSFYTKMEVDLAKECLNIKDVLDELE